MMSMLTFVVIMVALGTMIQRADVLQRYFGDGPAKLELKRDEVILRANTLSEIDVLANDLGLKDGDAEKLVITQQPSCGRVFVQDGRARYQPTERCAGTQGFRYAISGRDRDQRGEVIVVVRLGEPTQAAVAADAQRDVPATTPMVPRTTEQQLGQAAEPLAAQPETGGDPGGALVHAPAVPRPQAPDIAGLPDTASGAGSADGGGSAAAGVIFVNPGGAPAMTAPAGGLAQASEAIKAPVIVPPESETRTSADAGGTSAPGPAAATLALAQIDPAGSAPAVQRQIEGLGANVPRDAPSVIGSGAAQQDGFGEPGEALAAIRGLGSTTELAAVDTSAPAALADPGASGGAAAPQQPGQPADSAGSTAGPATGTGATAGEQVAALPSPTAPCTVPPSLILDVKPAGVTEVIVESPCHARGVAELAYDGLRFGVALDADGSGVVAAVGFQQASDAVLSFANGETTSFNIPFADTERMDRVALIWEMPVDLDLHAFEFGALPRGDGHVAPDRPRSFSDVRRHGGGYLLEYAPVGTAGQSISVYTFWRRHSGPSGVIKLTVDFANRDAVARPDTCSGGALAQPDFMVLRSNAGKISRPRHGRLASLDCATVAGATDRYITDAVDDMIVLER